MKAILIIILFFLTVNQFSTAQRVISGKVTTFKDMRVANIKIMSKNAGSAVLSDSTGSFSIVTYAKDVLSFSGEVFRKKNVKINRRTKDSITVELHFFDSPENQNLAVGYGYVRESDLTYATSNMNNRGNNFCSYSDMYELIKGRLPGVQVVGGAREPEILIRGQNSINSSNNALFVVDGNIVPSLRHISPCQVASINVLKDGATAIYGSRGANGVVIVELIKGSVNK
jgi:TonB-dependent SusC/RagA subfamily outer membrane receptor